MVLCQLSPVNLIHIYKIISLTIRTPLKYLDLIKDKRKEGTYSQGNEQALNRIKSVTQKKKITNQQKNPPQKQRDV